MTMSIVPIVIGVRLATFSSLRSDALLRLRLLLMLLSRSACLGYLTQGSIFPSILLQRGFLRLLNLRLWQSTQVQAGG